MPETIGELVLAIFSVSAEAGFTVAGVTITYASIIGTTILAAASFALSSSMLPTVPNRSESGQLSIQQPVPFRRRGYGRMKISGFYIFWTSDQGVLFSLVAVLAHEIDAFEEYWLADRRVALTGVNVTSVTAPPGANPAQYNPVGFSPPVQIRSSTGAPGKVAYDVLVSRFPGVWTDAHIGVGIADMLLVEGGVPQNIFSQVYPGGEQTIRTVCRGAKIYDPRDGSQNPADPTTWKYSDNWAAVILDYLTNADGWRVGLDTFLTGMAEAVTMASLNICDQIVHLTDGGSEKRYRIWGFYDFDEEPRQVLARMLAAGGGWLQPFPDGTIGIRAGAWVAPAFTITDDMILGYEVQHFVGEFDAINEIRATFNDPNNEYQNTESVPWQDTADIDRRGYIKSTSIDARHCPSYTQCRRIQKIASYEAMPEYTITLTLSMAALGARNQRFVNLKMSQLGLNLAGRITSFVTDTLSQTCSVTFASFPAIAYDWDPSTEEGPAPAGPADSSSEGDIETPSNLIVVVETRNITGGSIGPVMVMSCDAPIDRADLSVKFEYQLDGEVRWTIVSQGTQTYETETAILADGTYNVRASFFTGSNVQSVFATVDGVIVSVSTAAPGTPSAFSAIVATGSEVDLSAKAPNSANMYAGRFYRNSVNNFSTASDISGAVFATANQTYGYADNPSPGTWYYWTTAENSGGNKSSAAGPVTATV